MNAGAAAEHLVFERVRAALPAEYRLYPNVTWIGRTADHRRLRDGEVDLVIAHPDRGILVVEVKACQIARDGRGRWWAGEHELNPSPFDQARDNLHALLAKLRDLPDAPPRWNPIAGWAIALPDVDLESAGQHLRLLGPDVEAGLILDHGRLLPSDPEGTRAAIDSMFALIAGESAQLRPPGERGIALLEALLRIQKRTSSGHLTLGPEFSARLADDLVKRALFDVMTEGREDQP
jgi:Nuclease-related domain